MGFNGTKYDPKTSPFLAKTYAKMGMIDEQIAEELGISVVTLWDWRNKHPEFKTAMEEGKNFPNALVISALLKNALGYTYQEIVEEPVHVHDPKVKRGRGRPPKEKLRVAKIITKTMPPNERAQEYWLNNRARKEWNAAQKIDINSVTTGVTMNVADMSPEERLEWMEKNGWGRKDVDQSIKGDQVVIDQVDDDGE